MLKRGLQLVLGRAKSVEFNYSRKVQDSMGPYFHATQFGDIIWVSGQLGIDPETGDLARDARCQAKQCLFNIQNIVEECGSSMDSVVKVTVMLTDINDFQEVNEIYAKFFRGGYPTRSCMEVSALPRGALVEIEAVAVMEEGKEKEDDL